MATKKTDWVKERESRSITNASKGADQSPTRVILHEGTRRSHDNVEGPMDWAHTLGWMNRNLKMRRAHGKSLRQRLDELIG